MKGYGKMSLQTLKGGEAIALADELLPRIIDNFNDPATDPHRTRKLTLTVEFRPNKMDVTKIETVMYAQVKLAPRCTPGAALSIGPDDQGEICFLEDDGVQLDLVKIERNVQVQGG